MPDAIFDRRKLKTRVALQTAFLELLLEHGYSAIKTTEIADRANVGRSTCYEHYRNKQEMLCESVRVPFSILADLVRPDRSLQSVSTLLEHLRKNQQVARVLLSWPTRALLADTLAELITTRLPRATRGALLPAQVIGRQAAEAQLALIEIWIRGRPACSKSSMARALQSSTLALVAALTGLH